MAGIKKGKAQGKPQGTLNYSDDIKRLISSTYLAHKDWSAPQIHQTISIECKRKLWKCPGVSKVRKDIAGIKDKLKNETKLEPWSLASVSDYPEYFPPETIPILLEITGTPDIEIDSISDSTESTLGISTLGISFQQITVWTAIWVARLCKMQGFHGGWLYLAKWYATYEQSCKLSNIPCVTSRFDANSLERIDQNLRAYFGSKENIFKTPAGRTAFADQRQYDSTIFTRQVIEADKIEGKTLKKGKRPTKYSKELQEDASKSGFPIVTDEELTNEIKEQNKEGDNNG